MRKNSKKLKNLILYILANYNNPNLTETKLQKLLYFCDFGCYQLSGKSITGFKYKKNNFGPTIDDLRKYIGELSEEGVLDVVEGQNYFGGKKTTFSLKSSDIESVKKEFSDTEIRIIEEVNSAYAGLKPKEISILSHMDFPYLATEHKQEIDYGLVVYRDSEELVEDGQDYSGMIDDDFNTIVSKVATVLSQDGTA